MQKQIKKITDSERLLLKILISAELLERIPLPEWINLDEKGFNLLLAQAIAAAERKGVQMEDIAKEFSMVMEEEATPDQKKIITNLVNKGYLNRLKKTTFLNLKKRKAATLIAIGIKNSQSKGQQAVSA